MKYLPLLLVLLILVGCAPADTITTARQQYQVASANLSAAIAQQAAYDKATVQARQAEQIAALSTQGAQDAQIRDLEIQASATMQAIDARAQQADLENKAALATRIANDYNLQATQVWVSAQATQTAIALEVENKTAKNQRVQANADFWSSFLPDLARILIAALLAMIGILVWWVWRRAYHDDKQRKQHNNFQQAKDRFFWVGGMPFYLPEPTPENPYPMPILCNQLARSWLITPGDATAITEQIEEPKDNQTQPLTASDPRFLAQKLLTASAQAYGWESHDLFGYRQAGMGGRQWTEAVELIAAVCDNHIERRQGEGTRLLRENLQQAYYKVNQSPSPTIDVE